MNVTRKNILSSCSSCRRCFCATRVHCKFVAGSRFGADGEVVFSTTVLERVLTGTTLKQCKVPPPTILHNAKFLRHYVRPANLIKIYRSLQKRRKFVTKNIFPFALPIT
ncbi:hypothetical protein KP509_02G076500 [Ceratopteris richardii]|uniref:Uncharacterized protein n=1 Tax=Ceratopteris richardii TaxID=49495 RepID=A0A8T2VFK8_CERRI|nr:hypothetical protein KP509_02G076500 [Ceratopteris richardii]